MQEKVCLYTRTEKKVPSGWASFILKGQQGLPARACPGVSPSACQRRGSRVPRFAQADVPSGPAPVNTAGSRLPPCSEKTAGDTASITLETHTAPVGTSSIHATDTTPTKSRQLLSLGPPPNRSRTAGRVWLVTFGRRILHFSDRQTPVSQTYTDK